MDFYHFTDNFILWSLILGCFISYIPQYRKLYKNKNTLGINELMIISGYLSCFLNVIGSVEENLNTILNCRGNCYEVLVPIIQITAPFICSFILYLYYIYYYNNQDKNEFLILESDIIIEHMKKKRNVKIRSYISFISSVGICISLFFINNFYDLSCTIGKICNILSALLTFIMWYPQIYTTYKLKNHHSLSLLALCIHSFGCLVTIIYQLLFAHQEIWIVLCFIVSFLSELSLFILSMYYKNKKKVELFSSSQIVSW